MKTIMSALVAAAALIGVMPTSMPGSHAGLSGETGLGVIWASVDDADTGPASPGPTNPNGPSI